MAKWTFFFNLLKFYDVRDRFHSLILENWRHIGYISPNIHYQYWFNSQVMPVNFSESAFSTGETTFLAFKNDVRTQNFDGALSDQ